tara:strand:- start:8624 stop:8797 length:174 start_codon:yes stop_codon:yes gene_type:complete
MNSKEKTFEEHFATTEELLEKAFTSDRHTIHESIRDDNKETNQQESLCQNKRVENLP